jgi:hypothetical protein
MGAGAPDGGTAGPLWWLTEVGRIRHFGPRFSMMIRPMALQRRGKIVSLTFERRRAMLAAGNREAVRPKLEHGEGDPQCLPQGWWTSVKLLGRLAWHGRQRWHGNGVGWRVRVCLRGWHKLESRAPIYKPGTCLLVRETDSNSSPRRIHG